VLVCSDVGSAVSKYPHRQYVAPRRDFPSERAGSDAAASYRRPVQPKMRIRRPRARGYDSSCQKAEVRDMFRHSVKLMSLMACELHCFLCHSDMHII